METISHLDSPMQSLEEHRDAVVKWMNLPCNDRKLRQKRAEPCIRALERAMRMLENYERHLLPEMFSANDDVRKRHAAALQLVGATVEQVLWAAHTLCASRPAGWSTRN